MTRDEVLNVRVPAEIKDALRRAAEADERSVSTMTVRILREWLSGQGFLPVGDASARQKRRK